MPQLYNLQQHPHFKSEPVLFAPFVISLCFIIPYVLISHIVLTYHIDRHGYTRQVDRYNCEAVILALYIALKSLAVNFTPHLYLTLTILFYLVDLEHMSVQEVISCGTRFDLKAAEPARPRL